ncbi:hypothetical protein BH09BAC1_BH09BAC1_02950 [soil metagenome]
MVTFYGFSQSKGDTLYVAAHSGLNLRTEPGTKAAKLVAIPKGGQVVILADLDSSLAHSVTEFAGFDIKGFWVQVDYKGQVGYVFSGYLSGFKPFKNNKDWRGLIYNEAAYEYLWHNFANPKSINYYAIPDTCISGWTTHFGHGISYELFGACMEGGAGIIIEFSNHSLQEVYLFYLTMLSFPIKPIWDKETKQILAFDTGSPEQDDGGAGCQDYIYQKGKTVILRRECSC